MDSYRKGEIVPASVKRLEYLTQGCVVMHIAKSPYNKLMKCKSIEVLGSRVTTNEDGESKLILEYEIKTTGCKGVYTFFDIGPAPGKPRKTIKR